MLPNKFDPRWRKLVLGEIKHQFKSVPAGMCIFRATSTAKKDPRQEVINRTIDEVYNFFERYERLLGEDISAIFG